MQGIVTHVWTACSRNSECVLFVGTQAIENRLLIRRLVFERLLYSEMGEFEKLRTLDIEYRISADISQVLSHAGVRFVLRCVHG